MTSKADAIRMFEWYAMRWKIEALHKVRKSGCEAEDAKLRTAERLANLIAMMCSILAWRVLWLTMTNRTSPDLPAKLVFTDTEIKLLERLVPMDTNSRRKNGGRLPDPPRAAWRLLEPQTRCTARQHGYCGAAWQG